MPFVKVMIHAVWGTKNHYPFLSKEIKLKVISHIRENAHKKQIFIRETKFLQSQVFGRSKNLKLNESRQRSSSGLMSIILRRLRRKKYFFHIDTRCSAAGNFIDRLNGHTEHLHCLFGLNANMRFQRHCNS